MKKMWIFNFLVCFLFFSCQKEAVVKSESTGIKSINGIKNNASASSNHQAVTITAVYNFSTFPDVAGTFTTSGALSISGTSTMHIGLNANGVRGHCVVVLVTTDGTITIHQECEFSTSPPKGQWQIVSGTGAYSNLKGNGSLLMPPETEAMSGVIY
ncbi:MAG: hypothetical protein ACJ748_06755 [Flavisolibacter sp.]